MAVPKELPLETPSIDEYIIKKGADTTIDGSPEGMTITVGGMFDKLKNAADKDLEVKGALELLEEELKNDNKKTPGDIYGQMIEFIPGTDEYNARKTGVASVGGLKTRRRRKRRSSTKKRRRRSRRR